MDAKWDSMREHLRKVAESIGLQTIQYVASQGIYVKSLVTSQEYYFTDWYAVKAFLNALAED